MTALVFLWALVRALVVGVTPVPLSVFLLPIILPLLLRTPPMFVTLVLLRALRFVPATNQLQHNLKIINKPRFTVDLWFEIANKTKAIGCVNCQEPETEHANRSLKRSCTTM